MVKIVSWNVNGLKAVVKNRQTSLKAFLDYFDADIVCIQETKVTRSLISIEIATCEGYTGYFSFSRLKQGYSGVVTFCRVGVTPVASEEGITGHAASQSANDVIGYAVSLPDITDEELTALDNEGRAVLTEHMGMGGVRLVVINVYCPRVDPESPDRLPYKLNFLRCIQNRCKALMDAGKQVIVCGDFNCTREIIDSATLEEMPTFPRESETRELLSSYVGTGLVPTTALKSPNPILIDSFRFMHPNQRSAYTCWCTKTDSRKLNYGQRIDYIFISPSLKDSLQDGQVLQNELGSDHCPVTGELALTLTPSAIIPSLSSHHYPEFTGRQSKLSTYFDKVPLKQIKRNGQTCSTSSSKRLKSDNQATIVSLWNHKQDESDTCTIGNHQQPNNGSMTSVSSSVRSTAIGLSAQWKGVFKAPPKAPDCPGHKEPAVLRTVKKNGPNKNRKFYVCGRPDGAKSDPQSRCDFFQWAK